MSGYQETTVVIHKYKRIVTVINGNKEEEEIVLNLKFNVYMKNLLRGNNKLVTVHN
jgi:hypothetical protein